MLKRLFYKEMQLCFHPTQAIFLLFACFVFIPNYPYEVMFFFSGLSIFFVCLTARENGDLAFSCSLPVNKREVALARILYCAFFEVCLYLLAVIATLIKSSYFPMEIQLNMAGTSANMAFLGYGAMLLGLYNFIFFPMYFKNPNRVGMPFMVAAIVQFILIVCLITLRFAVPAFTEIASPEATAQTAKAIILCVGLALYCAMTALSALLSVKNFERTDL